MGDKSEARALLHNIGHDAGADLIERMGILLSTIADELQDEGDRVYLGSTNEASRIRDLAQEWRDIRYDMHAATGV